MFYPIVILNGYNIGSNPSFGTVSNGENKKSSFNIYKSYKAGSSVVKDNLVCNCFGSVADEVLYYQKKYGELKGKQCDIVAERIPYVINGRVEYSYRVKSVSVYNKDRDMDEIPNTTAKDLNKSLLNTLENDPFNN